MRETNSSPASDNTKLHSRKSRITTILSQTVFVHTSTLLYLSKQVYLPHNVMEDAETSQAMTTGNRLLLCADRRADCLVLAHVLRDPLVQEMVLEDLATIRSRIEKYLEQKAHLQKRTFDSISRNTGFGSTNRNSWASSGNDHLAFTFESLFPAIARGLRSTN